METGIERKRKRPRAKRPGTFHHGDLREALIEVATRAVEKDGHAALSLRPLAARLGVSQPAVYRHFRDKGALLSEIIRRETSAMNAATRAAAIVHGDPFAAMRTTGRAYVAWACDHPNLFRLFASRVPSDHRGAPHPPLPREHFYAGMCGIVPIDDPLLVDAFRVSWAMAHGLAGLVVERVFQLVDTDEERVAAAYAAIDCYVEMLRAKWPR